MQLRPQIVRLFVVAAALIALTAPFLAAARTLADATASISPGGGDLHTAFTLRVQGLTPGDGVDIVLYDGAGTRFSYQQDGIEQAIVVDDSGNASLTVTPAIDLPGSVAGTWTAVFTVEETSYTATIQFLVSP
ncbi:MAG TPA: hypothetical protein VFA70_11425 [Dehalococcoidia bacterium]|jgi:hypothetical protein|nr:hypothetical protein [Dehalococcoidia bacterium]